MARRCGPAAPHEEPETVVEPGRRALYPKGGGACRRKLDCQRDAVEATTNSGDRGHTALVQRELRRRRARPLDEQPNGTVAKRVPIIQPIFRGHSERWYRVNPLALCPEWLAAGGDHAPYRVGAQHRLGHPPPAAAPMLAFSPHQPQLPPAHTDLA